jgi:hypothetical protein
MYDCYITNEEISYLTFLYLALWHSWDSRRKFFEDYAKENEFDPYVAENWYLRSKAILNVKVI